LHAFGLAPEACLPAPGTYAAVGARLALAHHSNASTMLRGRQLHEGSLIGKWS
jgi:hypothetical protein